jgi:hypothetical protein
MGTEDRPSLSRLVLRLREEAASLARIAAATPDHQETSAFEDLAAHFLKLASQVESVNGAFRMN